MYFNCHSCEGRNPYNKYILLYILTIILILFGCKARKPEQSELGFKQELKKKFIEGWSIDDCKEELSKFEDFYLSKIKDLKGYSWDQKRFTASVEISNNKKLYITLTPTGSKCDSVRKTATFVVPKDFSYQNNRREIVDDLLWISKLLCQEENYAFVEKKLNENIDSEIESNQDDFVGIYPSISQMEIFDKGLQSADSIEKSFMAFFFRELDSSRYSIIYNLQ